MATFCLLHGAWHDGRCWDAVVADLVRGGSRALAPDLPLHDPSATYADRVQPALDALVAAHGATDGPVVVVGHSMGSGYVPGVMAAWPDALEVHLCPGLGRLRDGFPWPATGADGTCAWAPDAAAIHLYGALDTAAAGRLAGRLRPMAPHPRGTRPRPVARRRPPVVLVAEADELFDVDGERSAARERLGVEAHIIPGGHLPMAQDPGALATLLRRIAEGAAAAARPVSLP